MSSRILHTWLVAWLVLMALVLPILAQEPTATPAPADQKIQFVDSDPLTEPVAVILEGHKITDLRVTLYGVAPEDRAFMIRERFYELLENKRVAGQMSYRLQPEGAFILVDKKMLTLITPGDVDPASGETLETVAARGTQQLQLAWTEGREKRSLSTLGWMLGKTVVTTALYVGLLLLANRLSRFVVAAFAERTEKILLSANPRKESWLKFIQLVFTNLYWIFFLALTIIWTTAILEYFPYTQPWGDYLINYLLTAFHTVFKEVVNAVPGILVVVGITVLTHLSSQLLNLFFTEVSAHRIKVRWLDAEIALPTQRIATGFLWIAAVVMAYPYLPGSQSEAFKGISVLFGLLLSLGSSSITGQLASGLLLLYSRSFKIGEFVRVGEQEGELLGIGLVSTRLRAFTNEEISIPNSVMLSSTSSNFSRTGGSLPALIQVSVSIGYTVPWRQVQALLKQAAERTPELRKSPEPFVLQTALSDFYVEYQLNAYYARPMDLNHSVIQAALHANILDLFNEHGVQIMSPHYLSDPPDPQVVSRDRWYSAPAKPPPP